MEFFRSLDNAVFHFINQSLSNPLFDKLMPPLSGQTLFIPFVLLIAIYACWKGGARGRICVFMVLFAVAVGDGAICKTIKDAIARPRPFNAFPEANLLIGRGGSGSMPSAHAANWFAATMVMFIYYRRSLYYMLPFAIAVSFSRVYNGVHYPSDVLCGAILGAGYAVAFVWGLNFLWQKIFARWFLLWWQKLPSLINPEQQVPSSAIQNSKLKTQNFPEKQWVLLGYFVIFFLFFVKLWYLQSGKIELSEDEAYQWLWSKHLALSYYSKPLMIAFLQFFGTQLWGDTALGVRFFSPVIAAILGVMTLRFLTREVNARVGFLAVLIINSAPLLAVGSTLMTIDPPLCLFWTAAMFTGWRAAQPDGKTSQWLWVGLWTGLGFLSKYSALFQVICWMLFFFLWKPARLHLKKPGPYLALGIVILSLLPVWIWNAQHDWITVHHVADNAGRSEPWKPTLRYLGDFLGAQFGLLNPFFFVGIFWSVFAFWKKRNTQPLLLFFFCMGAPVFFGYLAFTSYKRVFPNWIAPAILPLLCLMLVYGESRFRAGASHLKKWLIGGICFGLFAIVILHDTRLIDKIVRRSLPPRIDPLRRVRAWKDTAQVVGQAREVLLLEGKPVFIIGAHYGLTGQISFYLPEARTGAQQRQPLAYYMSSDHPQNQLYFWSEYKYRNFRRGENAIFVQEIGIKDTDVARTPPGTITNEFTSVTDLGVFDIKYRNQVFRRVQLFACRDLK